MIETITDKKLLDDELDISIVYRPCQIDTNIEFYDEPISIKKDTDLFEILSKMCKNITYSESFYLVTLDHRLRILGIYELFKGGLSECVVDLRILMRVVLASGCSRIIIAHNHPSGHLAFSNEDIELTEKVKKCCETIGVLLLDHIIFTKDKFITYDRK